MDFALSPGVAKRARRRKLQESRQFARIRASGLLDNRDGPFPVSAKGRCFCQAEPGKRAVGVLRQLLAELVLGSPGVSQLKKGCAEIRVTLRLGWDLAKQTKEDPGGALVVSSGEQVLGRQLLPNSTRWELLREVLGDLRRQPAISQTQLVPGVWDRRGSRLLLVFPRGFLQTTAALECVTQSKSRCAAGRIQGKRPFEGSNCLRKLSELKTV